MNLQEIERSKAASEYMQRKNMVTAKIAQENAGADPNKYCSCCARDDGRTFIMKCEIHSRSLPEEDKEKIYTFSFRYCENVPV